MKEGKLYPCAENNGRRTDLAITYSRKRYWSFAKNTNQSLQFTGKAFHRLSLQFTAGLALVLVGILYSVSSSAQCTPYLEAFETFSVGATSFTSNGQGFTLSSPTSYRVNSVGPNSGWNGTSKDNNYCDNYADITANPQGTMSTSDGAAFALKSFWIYVDLDGTTTDLGTGGMVTVVGTLAGVGVFTVSSSSGFNTDIGTASGFTYIDMTSFGGSDNSDSAIDGFTIICGGNFHYFAVDGMTWGRPLPTATTSAATSVTGTGAVLNGSINANSNSTTAYFEYSSASSTLSSGVSTITATTSPVTGITSSVVTATVASLAPNTTYYYRATGANCIGTNPGSILSFTTTAVPVATGMTVPVDGTYITGQNLDFTVTFSEAVTVTGTPQIPITLDIGGTVEANYISGSGTNTLTFRYTIISGEQDLTGIIMGTSIGLNGGTIEDAATNNAVLDISSVEPSTAGVDVDAVAPVVTSVSVPVSGNYTSGMSLDFDVVFTKTVIVNTGGGTPYIPITLHTGSVEATYLSGSGTNTLTFRYTVSGSDEDADGIVVGSAITLSGGTLQDGVGNDANPSLNGVGSTTGVLVNYTAPTFVNGATQGFSICENASALDITSMLDASDITIDETLTWTVTGAPNNGGVLSGFGTANTASSGSSSIAPGNAVSYTPAASFNGTETFTIQVSDGTNSTSTSFTVTVNPSPSITTASAASVCSGAGPGISLTASTASSFSWTIGTNIGTITGATASSGSTINQTLTNPSNSTAGSIVYQVTPTSTVGSCVGTEKDITVTVNPTPIVTTAATASTCSSTGPGISLTASTASSFTWGIGTNIGAITGATASSGTTINQTLTDPSNSTAGSIVYQVIPTSTVGSCVGTEKDITVTVNPTPSITTGTSASTCNGTSPGISLVATTGSNFSWTIGTNIGTISGATASSGLTINQTLTNPSNSTAGSIVYQVIPTSTVGSCVGGETDITVTVNPTPIVTTASTASTCDGTSPDISLTASTASSFTWGIGTNVGSITGATASSGTTINQTLSNPSNSTAGSIVYQVTPTSTVGSCIGIEKDITVTVNPTPIVTTATTASTCSGTGPGISLTASTASSFTWGIGTNIGGITGATANSGTTINQTLTDPSISTAGSIVYQVIPTSTTGSCVGGETDITVTVNPIPDVTPTPSEQAICNGAGTTEVDFSSSVSTATYSWTNSDATIGTGASGSGNILSFTATNGTSDPVVATFTVTPSANSCTGTPANFTMTINPTPGVSVSVPSQAICNGTSSTEVDFSSLVTGATYSWTVSDATIGTGASGSGNILPFTATNATSVPDAVTFTVTPSANGCTGIAQNFTMTVNPTPNAAGGYNQALCNTVSTVAVNFSGSVTGTAYDWTNDNTDIGLVGSGIGDIAPFIATNTSDVTDTGTITVTPWANGCSGTPISFTIIVTPTAGITLANNPTVITGFTSVNLPYISATGEASSYNIVWSSAAHTASFTDVTGSALPASPIVLSVPPTALTGVYSATLTVTNTGACSSAGVPFTVTVIDTPTTWYSNPGTTTDSADQITSWWSNNDGTGANAINFTTAADTFVIQNDMYTVGDWSIAGALILNAGTFAPSGNISIGGYLTMNGSSVFSSIDNFSDMNVILYGNLTVSGSSSWTNPPAYTHISLADTNSSLGSPQTISWTSSEIGIWTGMTIDTNVTVQLLSNVSLPPENDQPDSLNGILVCNNFIFSSDDVYYSNAFVMNNGATLYTQNTGGIDATILSDTYVFSPSANYIFNGTSVTGAQITGFNLPSELMAGGSVTVNNPAGIVLSQSTQIDSGATFYLTSGTVTLGTNNLMLAAGPTLSGSGFSSSSMFVANGGGQVQKGFSADTSFIYPVGDDVSNYTPITVTMTAGSYATGAYAAVNLVNAKEPNNANVNDYLNRYWTVGLSGITSPVYSVSATYVSGDVTGTEANMSAGEYNGALPWIKYGLVNTTTHSLTANGVTDNGGDFTGIATIGPSVTSSTDTAICIGDFAAISEITSTGDPALSYSWAPAGSLSAATGTSVIATPTITTTYTVTITDGNGFTGMTTTTVTINPLPTAILGTSVICAGSIATLTDLTTGGTWSSASPGIASLALATGILSGVSAGSATVSYKLTATQCFTTSVVTVNPLPYIYGVEGIGSYCAGGTGIDIALSGSEDGIKYQLYNESTSSTVGGPMPGTGSLIDFGLILPAGTYTVQATDTVTGCTVGMADSAVVVVNPIVLPDVSIGTSLGDTVCFGSIATVIAVPVNGGPTPSYQWFVNGIASGTDSPAYSYYATTGDTVSVILTTSAPCSLAPTTVSTIVLDVYTPPIPAVSISVSPASGIVTGESVTLTATTINGGTSPVYQWLINGNPVPGATSSVFVCDTLADHDSVSCTVTASGNCGLSTFNSVDIYVSNLGVVPVSQLAGDIRLVPNPNNGSFKVTGSLGNTGDEKVSLEITDMLGQVIYSNTAMALKGVINEQVNLSNTIANGMYLLNVHSEHGNGVFHFVIEQ